MSDQETETMNQATRCVRKFAPEGKRKMQRTDNGHITACKISDANPNEVIVSWSGDHIYSFDLVRSPDASERNTGSPNIFTNGPRKSKTIDTRERKRKRRKEHSSVSLDKERRSPRSRQSRDPSEDEADLALRVRYENGQSEDISMDDALPNLVAPSIVEETRTSLLNDSQKRSLKIAKSVVKIRKMLFSLEDSPHSAGASNLNPAQGLPSFTTALGIAAICLPDMDEISSNWRYPMNPLQEDIALQQTLRGNRKSARRFVQAAGVLSRMLGGKIQTTGRAPSPTLEMFEQVDTGSSGGPEASQRELFCYDFLKAILLWLDGGPYALLQGFQRPAKQPKGPRYPVPDEGKLSHLDSIVIPHLLHLAGDKGISNVDASRFEKDETRKVFDSEKAAVIAFAHAIKMPLEDLSTAIVPAQNTERAEGTPPLQDKKTALKFWAFKVGRGLLLTAGEGVNFQYVDLAFGGLGAPSRQEEPNYEEIDPDEREDIVEKVSLVKRDPENPVTGQATSADEGTTGQASAVGSSTTQTASPVTANDGTSDVDINDAGSVVLMDDLHDEIAEHLAAEDGDEFDDENEEDDDNDNDQDDEDGDITAEERSFVFRSASDRGKLREKVERDVPCYSHTSSYRGHCNVKTVKDANFFGLQDEYVVSGSDGGHLFIWDKKTSNLVNILEGDGEVCTLYLHQTIV